MLGSCQCSKQELCFVHPKVCLSSCCFFLLSLYEDKIIFLKIRVASATDWGKPHISFNLGIHHLSATVGITGACLTLHHTYQLLVCVAKPTLSLLGPLAKPGGLAVLRGSPSPAAAPSKLESWEH